MGTFLWVASGWMPLLGGAAKDAARCKGREFTGEFDDCFNDYLRIAEFAVIIGAMLSALVFYRLADSVLNQGERAPPSGYRQTQLPRSGHALLTVVGAVWCLWRLSTYTGSADLWPFITFWLCFAMWFVAAAMASWSDAKGEEVS